jgi:hypothetical protein
MMKRSLFLALAAGFVASLAFAAPANAGSVTVTGSWSVPGAKASELDFFFSSPVTSVISFSGVPTPTVPTIAPNEVIFKYSPAVEGGTLTFTVSSAGGFLGGGIAIPSIVGSPSANNFNFATSTVPEPTSFALLGIGMAGFLAYRRLFKRGSVG